MDLNVDSQNEFKFFLVALCPDEKLDRGHIQKQTGQSLSEEMLGSLQSQGSFFFFLLEATSFPRFSVDFSILLGMLSTHFNLL